MVIEKVINNNVIGTRDDKNRELIVMGKGIGFQKKKGDDVSEEKIEKRFVLDDANEVSKFAELVNLIPLDYLKVSVDIIEYAKHAMSKRLSPSIYFSLADHINFALERMESGMNFQNPLFDEVRQFYPSEYLVGEYALDQIEKNIGVRLPKDEAASIALHLVNAEYNVGMSETMKITSLIREVLEIVEQELDLVLDELGLHYSRFVTHLKFMAQRVFTNQLLDNQDDDFLNMIAEKYPIEYEVSKKIGEYIKENYKLDVTKEELVYLTVYIRRVRPDID